MLALLSETVAPIVTTVTKYGEIDLFCPGRVPEWRAQTLLTKEPATIEWIDGFNSNEVFWDIGANVGVFSLYAALKGLSVIAFEPSPGNYYILNKNIELNKMDHKVSAYCIALNDETKLDVFYMAHTELGGALNSFGDPRNTQGERIDASYEQAMVGYSVDDFIRFFSPEFPNHIKIDVDGIEDNIINGGYHTFRDNRVLSVLVELDAARTEFTGSIIDFFKECGLHQTNKKESKKPMEGMKHIDQYNHIFKRI